MKIIRFILHAIIKLLYVFSMVPALIYVHGLYTGVPDIVNDHGVIFAALFLMSFATVFITRFLELDIESNCRIY